MKAKPNTRTLLGAALIASALLFPVSLPAADDTPKSKPAHGQRADAARERMQQMAKELQLTEAQKEKLRPVLLDQAKNMRDLRQNQGLSPAEKQEKLKNLRQEMNSRMKEILTEDQFAKWEGKRKELRSEAARKRAKAQ